TALGELLIFIIAFSYLFKHLNGMPVHSIILKPIFAGGIAYLVYYILILCDLPILLILCCLGLVYIVGLFALKTFDNHELKIFFQNTFLKKNRIV
ncbi:hypothetical protein MUP95_10070, partial [bacterium]|nr:hypothetical protein [bacterium]